MRSVILLGFVGVACGGAGCAVLGGLNDLTIVDCDDSGCASLEDASSGTAHDATTPFDATGADANDATAADTSAGGMDATGGDGAAKDGAPDAASDATTRDASGPCVGTAGPNQVRIGAFCIDSTEVTNDQYAAFLAASPATSLAGPACTFKTSFTPSSGWPVANKGNYPVTFVDWCDAAAYCAWAGKHLCGAIGGGPSARALVANKSVDAWYVACSNDGANVYPYGGSSYVSGKCNESESNAHGVRPVGSFTGCVGGYPGLFDMNGNVWEWEDACDVTAGASDACLIRGGSWLYSGAQYGGCPTYFNDYIVKRSDNFNDTGFRCCSQ